MSKHYTTGWTSCKLGDVLTLINGRAYKQPEMLSSGTPILRIQNLNGGSNWFYSDLELPEDKYCDHGDLLYAWSATFGPYIWEGPRAIYHYHIWNVVASQAIHKRFAYYQLMRITDDIKRAAHGVAMPHITKAGMESWPLLLPPLAEQARIADKLDVLLARVRNCRERLDRASVLVKRFRQSVLLAAVSGQLTEDWRAEEYGKVGTASASLIPSTWVQSRIERVAEVGTGSTPLRSEPAFYASKGTPWVTSAATGSKFVRSATEFVTDAAMKAHRLKLYEVGTLLVAMYGEGKTRGQVTELAIKATINQACAAIVVDESKALRSFVKVALQANYMEMRKLAEGGNQPNLNLSKVKTFPLSLPPMSEQEEISRRVAALLAFADQIEKRLADAFSAVDRLPAALLGKAFRGELVPQEPSDEPVAKLLKRLAEQGVGEVKTTKGTRGKRAAPVAPNEEKLTSVE